MYSQCNAIKSLPSKRLLSFLLSLPFLLIISTQNTWAQAFTERNHFDGPATGDELGASVTSRGDVNGDGVNDLIVGAPRPVGDPGPGSVFIYSGVDGSLIRQIPGVLAGDNFGFSVATADVNGDGFSDVIVGAPGNSGDVYVYSGNSGSLLWHKSRNDIDPTSGSAGWHVETIADLNGDGLRDILVGTFGGGSAYILSGINGATIYTLISPNGPNYYASGGFGICISSIGDTNGDGKEDVIVGTEMADTVYIYSGATGSLLTSIADPDGTGHQFGQAVSGGGDINGDGIPDFILGARGASPSGRTAAGSVFVYSGSTFQLLTRLDGEAPYDDFGGCCGAISAVKDVNGDGRADIVAAAGLADPSGRVDAGSVYVYSYLGTSWTLLKRFDGAAAGDQLGTEPYCGCGGVSNDGDANGDGRADIVIGGASVDAGGRTDAGRTFVYVSVNPSISSLSPTSGSIGTSVTINGSNFGADPGVGNRSTALNNVTLNGVQVASANITSWSTTAIQFTVPSGATTGPVRVTAGGILGNVVTFTVLVGPQISSLAPGSGAAATAVTINGSGFGATQGTSTVTFNGIAAAVSSWSAAQILASVPCTASTGPVVVTVGGVASNGVSFTVIPQISSLTPSSGTTGASVTINGCGFGASQGTSTVTFNGLAATTYTSWGMTQVVAIVPSDATTGSVAVRVGGNSSNTLPFTVVPSISSLSPTSGQGSLTQVAINGSGFGVTQGTSAVTFTVGAASVAAPIVSWGNRQINATVPCLIAAGAGTVKVTVGGLASNTPAFTIQPSITTMTPTTGSVGTRVTITGCNFGSSQGTSTLSFNGVQTIVDPSRDVNDVWTYDRISTLVPPGTTTGPVLVTVGGQASNSLTFTITISIACAETDCKMFPDKTSVMWNVSLYPNGWTSDVTLSTSIINEDTLAPSDGLFTLSYAPNPVPRPTTGPQTSVLTITVLDPFLSFGRYTVTITANGGAIEVASFEQLVDPIITLAGNGQYGFSGDGGQATAAKLYNPIDTVSDTSGNIYIADRSNNRIRKVSPAGVITTVAGTGSTSCLGDGGAATSACVSAPYGVALDSGGNLYIADYGHCRIRKVTPGGTISTVAGTGTCGFAGDGGAATSASLQYPTGVFVDGSGNIFIADRTNQRIRKVTAATGVITTIAGTGVAGFSGDGGAATSATLNQPRTIYVNTSGEVFVADASNHRVRKISAIGVISTFAGTGSTSCLGDGGSPTAACLYSPSGVSGDSDGIIYIADTLHNRVRKIAGGIISTVAGTGAAGYNGDNITPTKAKLQSPWGVHVHTLNGNKYMEIADTSNMRVRRVWPLP